MLKILDRYILRSFFASLAAILGVMLGLYVLVHVFSHVQDFKDASVAFRSHGYSLFGGMMRYYAVHIPEMVVMLGPYVILLAGMYSLHQLNQNNELTPMFSVGVSRLRVAAPIFFATTLLALGLMGLKQEVVPGLSRQMVLYFQLLRGKTEWVDESLPILQDGNGNVFDCGEWDAEHLELRKVWIETKDGKSFNFDRLTWTGDRKSGHWTSTEILAGFNPEIDTDLDPTDVELEQRTRNRMSFGELKRLTERRPDRKDLETMMHGHVTYALSPLVLLLLGLPLVLVDKKKNVFAGLALCLVLSLLYFSSTLMLQRLGAEGTVMTPFLSAWLPVIVFGAVGLLLFEFAGV